MTLEEAIERVSALIGTRIEWSTIETFLPDGASGFTELARTPAPGRTHAVFAALSDKDRADLEFACQLGVDWLAKGCLYVGLAMALAGRNPHTAIGRDNPGAIVSFYFHQTCHGIEHLRPPVHMKVQQGARGVVCANRQQGAGGGIHAVQSYIVHKQASGRNERIVDRF